MRNRHQSPNPELAPVNGPLTFSEIYRMLPKRLVEQIPAQFHLDKNTTGAWNILINPLLLIFIVLAWLLSIDMHLSADGVEHLRLTLVNNHIFIVNEARFHAYWLLQWPVEIALLLGAHQLNTFVNAFAFGVFLY